MTSRAARLWLIAIVAAAALLRLAGLGSNPAGLFRDEAEKGYSAWSLARTGCILDLTDVPTDPATGLHVPVARRLPLFLNVWGSQTSTIYQFADVPFVAALGPTWVAVRLPAALAGVLTVFLTWGLARELTRDDRVALWAAGLVAMGPWNVVLSRWAHQGIFVPVFMTVGVWAAARAWRRGEERSEGRRSERLLFVIAAATHALAFYTYSGARPFLLAFWAGAALLFWRGAWARRRALVPAAVVFAALLAPSLRAMLGGGGEGLGRFQNVSIFGAGLSAVDTALLFASSYFAHFSPSFLFFSGDANMRHGVPGFGMLLWVEAIWLVAGLGWIAFHRSGRRSRGNRLLLLWLALFPLSAALTREGIPHALRTLHAVPAPQIVGAIGAVWVVDWLRRRAGRVIGALPIALMLLNAAAFAVTLLVAYPVRSAQSFEYGVGNVVRQFRQADGGRPGRLYVVPGENVWPAYELYLFHLRTAPSVLLGRPLEEYPIQFVPPGPAAARVVRNLSPGDGMLLPTLTALENLDWFDGDASGAKLGLQAISCEALRPRSWLPGQAKVGAQQLSPCLLFRRPR